MRHSSWSRALAQSPDPARARHFLELLRATSAGRLLLDLTPEQTRVLVTLLGGSQALSETLVTHPDWLELCLNTDDLRGPRREQGLRRELQALIQVPAAAQDWAETLKQIRLFKQRQQLRIGARDLARYGQADEITREISNLADVCVSAVYEVCRQQLRNRSGEPWHLELDRTWSPTRFCILGLGKHGGQELNYSSDIDLLFLYTAEGWVFREKPTRPGAPGKGMANHAYFQRLVEALVGELTRLTPEGFLYRVDLRLRPEGDAGPLARSLSSYENYYTQWGQTWERMMLIKARGVAGDASLAAEFLELIQPFRYPRSVPERALREISDMKDRIEAEVVRTGELERNVKLGRGGIREIEFVVQSLQLLHAGRQPFLQGGQTLPALDKAAQYHLLAPEDVRALKSAYLFLRDVEHRLQMDQNLQTHTIPTEAKARQRLAALMGFSHLARFQKMLREHARRVRTLYETLLKSETSPQPRLLPRSFDGTEPTWHQLLRDHAFRQPEKSLQVLQGFVEGPGYGHVSPRTVDLALQLIHRLLQLCPHHKGPDQIEWPSTPLSDPDRVVTRLESFVGQYGSRSMLYELWTSHPAVFDLLVLLFDRSEFLAETAIRTPDLVEDLVVSGHLRRRKSAEFILEELQHGQKEVDQRLWLRRYHKTEFMRLGLRDILGLADFEQNLAELSGLADACLEYALEAVLRKRRLRKPPFAILGLGKLGGGELTYGSDLDILFVTEAPVRQLPALQKIAVEVMDMLSSSTELGVAFHTDARLRPDGDKGLLVNTLRAHEAYYRKRALLWEIQAISRSRFVAGHRPTGQRFVELAAHLSDFSKPRSDLAAYRPDWREEIHRMRARIEKERTPAGKSALAIKTGPGGLVDAEFIAQTFCLAHGWHEPNTLRALERAREHRALEPGDGQRLIDNYRRLHHIEGILRRWSFEGEAVLPDDPAPQYRVAVRCGYHSAAEFLEAVSRHREAIRSVYRRVFPLPTGSGTGD